MILGWICGCASVNQKCKKLRLRVIIAITNNVDLLICGITRHPGPACDKVNTVIVVHDSLRRNLFCSCCSSMRNKANICSTTTSVLHTRRRKWKDCDTFPHCSFCWYTKISFSVVTNRKFLTIMALDSVVVGNGTSRSCYAKI